MEIILGNNFADTTRYSGRCRFLIQGGWDSSFCDHDPFLYKTEIAHVDNSNSRLFRISFDEEDLDASGEMSNAYLFEGLSVNEKDILIDNALNTDNINYLSIYNCSFTNNVTPVLLRSYNGSRHEVYLMNSSFGPFGNSIFFYSQSGTINANIINTTSSDFALASSLTGISSAFGLGAFTGNPISLNFQNSIMWSPNDLYSVSEFENRNCGIQTSQGAEFNVKGRNSVLAKFGTEDVAPLGNWSYDTIGIRNVDPILGKTGPFYTLQNISPFIEKSTITGMPYEGDAPDLGVNTYAYSSIRLIDSISVIPPDCIDGGTIELFVTSTNKDLEFSLDINTGYSPVSKFENLPADDYIVYIRTTDNCAHFQQKVSLTTIDLNQAINLITNDASCSENNGIIELEVPQDWDDYSYAINDTINFQEELVFDSLSQGEYIVWVQFPDGCFYDMNPVMINSQSGITLDTTMVMSTSCGLDNGSVELQVLDATGIPVISINGMESTELSYNTLASGNYTAIVTDDLGCRDSLDFMIADSDGITVIDTLVIQPSCGLENGSIALQINDPTNLREVTLNGQPISFLLNNNLPPDIYDFLIIDNDGCTDSLSISLSSSEPITIIQLDSLNTTCAQNNGSIIFTTIVGGATEYEVAGSIYENVSRIDSLPADDYTFIARNENCADTMNISILDSTQPELSIAMYDDTSCGGSNGSADLNVLNGTGPYNFELDTISSQTGTFSNLPAGEYIAYVEDINDCIDTDSLSILDSEGVELKAKVTDGVCGGLGSISLVAAGGGGTYEFGSNGQNYSTNPEFNNLEAGEYTFYLRDADGCFDTLIQTVTIYEAPELSAEIIADTCEASMGSIQLSGSGGYGLLQYGIKGESFSDITNYDELSGGNYIFQVSDSTDCITEKTIEVPITPKVTIEEVLSTQLFCGDTLGEISYASVGGTGQLTYEVRDMNEAVIDDSQGLIEGNYRLVVIDELGCQAEKLFMIAKEDCQIYIPSIIDPSSTDINGSFRVGVPMESNFKIESFRIFDRWGNLVYDAENIDPQLYEDWWDGTYNDRLVEQGAYVYIIKVSGAKDSTINGTITVVR